MEQRTTLGVRTVIALMLIIAAVIAVVPHQLDSQAQPTPRAASALSSHPSKTVFFSDPVHQCSSSSGGGCNGYNIGSSCDIVNVPPRDPPSIGTCVGESGLYGDDGLIMCHCAFTTGNDVACPAGSASQCTGKNVGMSCTTSGGGTGTCTQYNETTACDCSVT